MANRPSPPVISVVALSWHDYETPGIHIFISGPKGGTRGSGEISLDEARKLHEKLGHAIAEVEAAL